MNLSNEFSSFTNIAYTERYDNQSAGEKSNILSALSAFIYSMTRGLTRSELGRANYKCITVPRKKNRDVATSIDVAGPSMKGSVGSVVARIQPRKAAAAKANPQAKIAVGRLCCTRASVTKSLLITMAIIRQLFEESRKI